MNEINQTDFNIFKAKAISRGKLLDRFRNTMIEVKDHIQDEGDRVFFGSTNDAEQLKEVIQEMDELKWDRIIAERPESDPYELCRKQRALIETLIAALVDCEDYFDNRSDADCDQDGFIPNDEMRMLQPVREALAAAKREGF